MPLKTLTGLWRREPKSGSGKAYYSGKLSQDVTLRAGTWLQVHKNTKRPGKEDSDPDLTLTVQEDER